ncbi:hypothetical protein DFH07DRAFT_772680 [Mycena maculata]|uniref:Uncharacterized protein n=1 Tax=Mycena maculata TaxID=230809 RepID=A0AAD7ME20_9AGAR|nr:hypothetical protein DFH07DRAFT_1020389 [Mycena maculata]KAJ7758212.1 hypothetical protein DFH07DRAFT_772680 [Mycena maculata]
MAWCGVGTDGWTIRGSRVSQQGLRGLREVHRVAIVIQGNEGEASVVRADAFGMAGRQWKRPHVAEKSRKGAPNEWEVLQVSGRCAKRVAAKRRDGTGRGGRGAPMEWEVRQESSGHTRNAAPAGYGSRKREGSWDFPESDVPQNRGCATGKSCGGSNSSVLDLEIGQGGLINMRNDYRPLSAVKSDGNKVFRTKNLGGPRFDQPPPTVYPAVWIFFSEGSEHWEQ